MQKECQDQSLLLGYLMGQNMLNALQQAETRDRKQKSIDTRVRAHGRIINSLNQDSEIRMEKQGMLTCMWQWRWEEHC